LSDRDVSVQHKIRTSDILTDGSTVIGRDPAPGKSQDSFNNFK
jgi:hypothetical protein